MEKLFVLFSFLCILLVSCASFNDSDSLEINNKTSGIFVIQELSGRFQSTKEVVLNPNESISYEENGKGESVKITLSIKDKNYLLDTGYITDYKTIIVYVNDGETYTVYNNKNALFSDSLSLLP